MIQYQDHQLALFKELTEKIFEEHRKQIKKWGVQKHTLFGWNTILMEEVGELSQAMLNLEYGGVDQGMIAKEAIQVATLSLKIAEMVAEVNRCKKS